MRCMQAFQLQPTLHIIPDKEIISRHLAADDVKPLIIRAADNKHVLPVRHAEAGQSCEFSHGCRRPYG